MTRLLCRLLCRLLTDPAAERRAALLARVEPIFEQIRRDQATRRAAGWRRA